MIQMWDEMFSLMNPAIGNALNEMDGMEAYLLMNEQLDKIWVEVDRTVAPGGIVAINIGDATRKVGGRFQLYSNHSHITRIFEDLEYQVLPLIIWKKESNKPTKFMGSGMIPPNAYVTLEHEYILLFRKEGPRRFSKEKMPKRKESSYFWEERNSWFSDIWHDLKGISQGINDHNLRSRTAAYPLELVYRLINMYSVQDDLVLDPFLGTGTTTLAAVSSARNSVGYELESNFTHIIEEKLIKASKLSKRIVKNRLDNHAKFVRKREKEGKPCKYQSLNYQMGVTTKAETYIKFPLVKNVQKIGENYFEVSYHEK